MSLGETLKQPQWNRPRWMHEPEPVPPFRGYDAEPGLRDFCLAVAQQFESAKEARRAAREQGSSQRKSGVGSADLGRDAARSAYLARVLRDSEPAATRPEPHAAEAAAKVRGAGK